MYKAIPKYNSKTKKWSTQEFKTKQDLKEFVWSKFKKPGEINLRNTWAFRQEAANYDKYGFYTAAPFKSKDYIDYWNQEKNKSINGIIVDDFYVTGYYYFWLNYLPINDKEINKLVFPRIWDSQYYFFLYLELCHLEYKYSVVVKKRQWGSTFQHIAILINDVWFQEGYINKIGASDEEYLLADWSILEEYRNFLNAHTAWYRPFNPDKTLNWQQKWEIRESNRKRFLGNKSIIKGVNFKISPTKGVGGKNNKFYYEEAGITKTMGKTFSYIDPALKLGAITTGMFMAGGSVGELEQCDDLRKMAFNPDGYNILSVKNDFNETSETHEICFFVPEYWSMPPYIDENGNSLVEEAKQWATEERARQKINSTPEDYRMYISQHPFSLEEAFAYRKESIFPVARILKQQERITAGKIKPLIVTLERDKDSKIKHTICDTCRPIESFPLGEKAPREGAIMMWEPPIANPPLFTYFAGVDPISVGKTTTSSSLFSVYIMKNLIEETYLEKDEKKLKLSGYNIVASYIGRYDDLTQTNEIAEMLLMYYNALAAVENNVMSFINHMQAKGLQRYLATRDQLAFVSELKTNANVFCPYGFKMNPTIWTYFVDLMLEYLTVKLDEIKKSNSEEVVKTVWGVERIQDMLLLEEMRLYHDKLNVDRLVSFGAALALMKTFSKYGAGVIKIDTTDDPDKNKKGPIITVAKSFFKNLGKFYTPEEGVPKKNFFKTYN